MPEKAETCERLVNGKALRMSPLDHLVLPVADLSVARARLSTLGFSVAANGLHPFGTENCCVYFADNTFIEPLMIGDRCAYDAASLAGNRFVLGDQGFRANHGGEGLSAVVFGSDDAQGDHARFVAAGCSAGEMLDFSRLLVFPDGQRLNASFRLAFGETGSASDIFVFTCQRINILPADRTALVEHPNGVVGIQAVVLVADEPGRIHSLLTVAADGETMAMGSDAGARSERDRIHVLTPAALADTYGLELREETGVTGRLIVFAVTSMVGLRAKLAMAGIDHFMNGAMLLVPPVAGQGVAFAFSEV